MKEKVCRRCEELKPLSDYYKHAQMFDGHLNICKECTKKRVGRHRVINIDEIREYDRGRGKLEHRKNSTAERTRLKRENIEGYQSCHNALSKAVTNGKVKKPPVCSWCGDNHNQIEGHHPDYSKPLLVFWLCSPCHKILHNGKGKATKEMRGVIGIPEKKKRTTFRKLKTITYNGITKPLSYWEKETGISYITLSCRKKSGMPDVDIIEKPVVYNKRKI